MKFDLLPSGWKLWATLYLTDPGAKSSCGNKLQPS